MKLWHRLQRT